MEFDPIAYLATKGLRGRPTAGGREMQYACFFDCQEPSDSAKKKLYLNVAESVYHCFVCQASGGSHTLQKHFGDNPRAGTNDDPFVRRRVLDAAVQVGQTVLDNNPDVELYLIQERGLTPETIQARKLGFIAGGWSLVDSLGEQVTKEQIKSTGLVHREGARAGKDFFYRHLLIPYLSRGHCIQMRGRIWGEASGGKYMTGPGEPVRLFGSDSLDGAEEVIITEGEFDAMILAQELAASPEQRARRIAVVALPGVASIPEEFDDLLSGVKRIYLGLDSDEAGTKGAEKLKERLGNRARILQLPYRDGRKCDWTEYLLPAEGEGRDWRIRHPYAGNDWRDVLRLLSSASGKRVFSMAEAGEAFRAYRAEHSGLTTGFTPLDERVLNPGILPGQVMVVLAKTGCLAGDSEIAVNRAGKGFKISIAQLLDRWEGKKHAWDHSTPTYVQREEDGVVRLARLRNAWRSGVKTTYTVTTDTGRSIRATDEHPFLTQRGWLRLDQLVVGDQVHALSHADHPTPHADEGTTGNAQVRVATEGVVSVELFGQEETYDLEVEDDPHNFMANGFVVHNSGKTIFLCNLAYNMRAQRVLFVSLEMTREEVYERMRRIYLFHHRHATDAEVEAGLANVYVCDENRLGERDLENLVAEYVIEAEQPPEVIFVDYLGYYARGARGNSPYEKTTNAIMQLKATAKSGRLVVITPHQVNRGAAEGKPIDLDDARDSGAVEETADFLLALFRPDDALSIDGQPTEQALSGKVRCSVLKSRHGGKGRTFSFQMDMLSLAIVDDGTREANRAMDHNVLAQQGKDWNYMRAKETAPRQLTFGGSQ